MKSVSPKEDQIRAVVSQQAADWVVTNQDGMPDELQRADFVAWLKASPIHVDEYLGMALVARDLRAVTRDAEGSPEALLEQARADRAGVVAIGVRAATPEPTAKRLPFGSRWALAASAAAVLLAAAVWWALGAGFSSVPTAYRTAHGEQNVAARGWLDHAAHHRLAVTVRYSAASAWSVELRQFPRDRARRAAAVSGRSRRGRSDSGRHPVRGLPQAGEHRGDGGRRTGRRIHGGTAARDPRGRFRAAGTAGRGGISGAD
jgi:hypothetical protein